MSFFDKQIAIIDFADKLDLKRVQKQFARRYMVQQYRDALHIDMPKGQMFAFNYGVVVFWGVNPDKKAEYLKELKTLALKVHDDQIDTYEFQKAETSSAQILVVNDTLSIPDYQTNTLLALSHAFAQSAKLQHYEEIAEKTISSNQHLTKMLAKTGKIALNRKQLAMLRGELFQTKTDILLHYNLLDTPEYFWDFPAFEHLYTALGKYLELNPRIEILNLKLQTIQDLFDMLAAEQNHKHSSFLEWIIIILIAIEIVIFFGEYFGVITH
ncbi:RMD1 family protein [Glaciecola sp. KUL10]|uniref:RMD1 family protein n=1 Tax=Glaciecola sp. (strain KUL10) TaxID=2161813 RepID=UPI000D789BB0|nr:RMD1 family protein [Glaciecola sp. KUL10]GBL04467.1 hypothetical protein KUL10_17730 [Glaciecola sp. KUL10]